MTTKWMLLVAAAVCAITLTTNRAHAADLQSAAVTSLSGQVDIEQDIPCGGHISKSPGVTGGGMLLAPAEGVDTGGGNKVFYLTRLSVFFANFTASGGCGPFSETDNYTGVAAALGPAVALTAVPSGGGLYTFTIPKATFLLQVADVLNGSVEHSLKQPSADPTGTINLSTGAFSMHVVTKQTIHFKAGCFIGCIIDEDDNGSMTTDVSGTIAFPDTDGDGVPDRTDNCRFVPNADQSPVPTPTIAAPDPVTLNSCLDHGIGIANAVDVCDGGPVSVTNNAPVQFATGPNTVTWTATDARNRSATALQTVTIVDTTKPTFTFVPLDIHATNCGPVDLGQATATDDCAGVPTITNDSPGYFFVGTTPVTWKATDASGNFSTAVQNVIVVDLVPPTVACTPSNPTGDSFVVTGFDACGPPVLRLGTFVIANGEQIKIEETGQAGIRLKDNTVSSDGVRHFLVGKGQGVITATDGSNNVSTAVCR